MPPQAVKVLRSQPDNVQKSVVTVGSGACLLPERMHQCVKRRIGITLSTSRAMATRPCGQDFAYQGPVGITPGPTGAAKENEPGRANLPASVDAQPERGPLPLEVIQLTSASRSSCRTGKRSRGGPSPAPGPARCR